MIDKIKDILDNTKYSILNNENGIEIYTIKNKVIVQDKYIRIVTSDCNFVLYVISRDIAQKVAESLDENFTIGITIVLCKKYFEHPQIDNIFARELRTTVDKGNFDIANQMLEKKCNNKYYSLYELEEGKVCLFNRNGNICVLYKYGMVEKEIVQNAQLSRAYVVVFNYATLLENYDYIYKTILKNFETNNNFYYMLLEYYMLF